MFVSMKKIQDPINGLDFAFDVNALKINKIIFKFSQLKYLFQEIFSDGIFKIDNILFILKQTAFFSPLNLSAFLLLRTLNFSASLPLNLSACHFLALNLSDFLPLPTLNFSASLPLNISSPPPGSKSLCLSLLPPPRSKSFCLSLPPL